jgi:ubiquitin carboxyl-terminal hydrolase L3
MADSFNWPPLEGNPEIFQDYMSQCGLPDGWGFGEIYGFEEELLGMVPTPVIAVICNMEILDKTNTHGEAVADYFMAQTGTLDNACGVIACLHSVLNNLDKLNLTEGKILKNFYDQVKEKSAAERAAALEANSEFQ